MSRCACENSQISAQDTVGVAGDDIMFHILVVFVIGEWHVFLAFVGVDIPIFFQLVFEVWVVV